MKTRTAIHLVVVFNLIFLTSVSPISFIQDFKMVEVPAAPTTTRYVCALGCTYTSIQAAINASGPGDIVDLASEIYTETISIDENITLLGEGAEYTIIQAAGDPDSATDRVITVVVTATTTIDGITIRYGKKNGGGGIHNRGILTVTNSVIISNTATNNGGGIFNTGKTSGEHSKLTIIDSVIQYNTAQSNRGGGIYNYANNGDATIILVGTTISINNSWYGGGINNYANNGTATIDMSKTNITGNISGAEGGGIINHAEGSSGVAYLGINDSSLDDNIAEWLGGGIYSRANNGETSADIRNSTISNNNADKGGGIHNLNSIMTLTNVTISNNNAELGGGINNNGDGGVGIMEITASTISTNTASINVGGIFNHDRVMAGTGAVITMTGSIIANNTNGDCLNALIEDAVFNNNGFNIIETGGGSCGTTGDGDPSLGPLQDNGGPTFTHALLVGSPAIDQIPSGSCLVSTDQRGIRRPLGYGCDIGSFESEDYLIFLPLILR